MVPRFEFDKATQAHRVGEHEFEATLSERWNARPGRPNGGYTLAVCLRALHQEMDAAAFPDPLVASATYLRPVINGAAHVVSTMARIGRRVSSGEVSLSQDGQQRVRVIATFTNFEWARGSALVLVPPPKLAPPARCIPLVIGTHMPGASTADNMEYRYERLPGWASGCPGGSASAEFWMRFRDDRPADTLSLAMMVDAAPPVVLELGETDTSTVQLHVHVRGRPRTGWLACQP
jgi:hypothetical protein